MNSSFKPLPVGSYVIVQPDWGSWKDNTGRDVSPYPIVETECEIFDVDPNDCYYHVVSTTHAYKGIISFWRPLELIDKSSFNPLCTVKSNYYE